MHPTMTEREQQASGSLLSGAPAGSNDDDALSSFIGAEARHGSCDEIPIMKKSSAIHSMLAAAGTPGTKTRDSRIALLLLGLTLAACGGESAKSGSDDSTSGTSSGGASSGGSSSTGNTGGTNCSGGDPIDPGCFGSPGPVTNGSTTSVGAGGSTSGSTDTTSGSSGGSVGVGGAGGSAGAACQAQDVSGAGECAAAFGVFFLGDRCGWLSGCNCVGSDCDNGYDDEAACEAAHRECLVDDCAPQDIAFVGDCDPAGVSVFNGIECVGMEGCSCHGDDCDASYSSLEACTAAHAHCAGREQSCDDIAAAYGDYVGHTACQDDGDCVIVEGLCAAGHGCAHVVNRHWGKPGIDAFTETWDAAGCPQVDCDCEVPESARCNSGVCEAVR